MVAFEEGTPPAVHPMEVQEQLLRYWNLLENWTHVALSKALEQLEDKYSPLLPHVPHVDRMTPELLRAVAKDNKKSAPGLDGWTQEVASLPVLRERKISPKFFRPKFFHGRPRGMPVRKCLFFQDLEGLTEVFGRTSAGMSSPKLPLWAEFSF